MITRSDIQMNLGWARNNPGLFVEKVIGFQEEFPVTDWRHEIDLSQKATVILTAHRREQ